ncbi:hypothetical protein A3850_002405 [Lewinella sp. 4G2]|nr:hypothetical protein A3850_002405 [Lewinella sp. 4G2]
MIIVEYQEELNDQIEAVYRDLKDSRFRTGVRNAEIFALVNDCDYSTTITFNYTANLPESVQKQVNTSRRFILLDGERVPVLFYFDNGNSPIRKGGVNHGLIGGMLIKFNTTGEVILKGPVE